MSISSKTERNVLSHQEVRSIYDRFGAKQDSQAYYEDPALDVLVKHSAFGEAQSVFEFGCGTGRFAARLFDREFGPQTTYQALDLSPIMIDIAKERLAEYSDRIKIIQSDGSIDIPYGGETFDRFLSTYVIDLLPQNDATDLIAEAYRVLVPGGLLCLASLTQSATGFSVITATLLSWVHRISPKRLGGCRPVHLLPLLSQQAWELEHVSTVTPYGIASEILIARKK